RSPARQPSRSWRQIASCRPLRSLGSCGCALALRAALDGKTVAKPYRAAAYLEEVIEVAARIAHDELIMHTEKAVADAAVILRRQHSADAHIEDGRERLPRLRETHQLRRVGLVEIHHVGQSLEFQPGDVAFRLHARNALAQQPR